MKKMFGWVLAAVCLFSILVCEPALAITDNQQKELVDLGIMTGDPNGNLRLDSAITRAEAIKMICTVGNIGTEIIEAYPFPDVPETHWAYGFIAAAKAEGIVNGDERGNFNPESSVTNEEIIKMAVSVLGYETMAEMTGGYPAGYTAAAAQIGLTEGMRFSVNESAVRSDVATLIYRALDIPLMMEKIGEDNAKEYIILDGTQGTSCMTLRNRFTKYDSSRDTINRLAQEFASQYKYHEGDTEKSFALYPDIIYTSGMEKTADGREYECPAIYDDLMVPELINGMQTSAARLQISGETSAYDVSYVVFKEQVLVPLQVFALAGCEVQLDKTRQVASIRKNDTVLEILPNIIGMRKNQAEGFWIPLAVCARWIDNTLYVPIEAVASEFGMAVQWDAAAHTITLQ